MVYSRKAFWLLHKASSSGRNNLVILNSNPRLVIDNSKIQLRAIDEFFVNDKNNIVEQHNIISKEKRR